jgi:hypothetical protein
MKQKQRSAYGAVPKALDTGQGPPCGQHVLPAWVIGFLAITCYPLIYSILISFIR